MEVELSLQISLKILLELKPIKAQENSNLRTYPMALEFYSFWENLEFYIHPPV